MLWRRPLRSSIASFALLIVGCGVNVTIESSPNPAQLGQPMTFTIRSRNILGCNLENVVLTFLVVTPAAFDDELGGLFPDGRQFCSLLNDPLQICSLIAEEVANEDVDPSSELVDTCCQDSTFAQVNPGLCAVAVEASGARTGIRDAVVALARSKGAAVDRLLGGQLQAVTSGAMPLGCVLVDQDAEFAIYECDLGDIDSGESQTVTATFIPQQPGTYFAMALVEGTGIDCSENLVEGGTGCIETAATAGPVTAPAPAASAVTLAAAVVGLLILGGAAIRTRRRIAT